MFLIYKRSSDRDRIRDLKFDISAHKSACLATIENRLRRLYEPYGFPTVTRRLTCATRNFIAGFGGNQNRTRSYPQKFDQALTGLDSPHPEFSVMRYALLGPHAFPLARIWRVIFTFFRFPFFFSCRRFLTY